MEDEPPKTVNGLKPLTTSIDKLAIVRVPVAFCVELIVVLSGVLALTLAVEIVLVYDAGMPFP